MNQEKKKKIHTHSKVVCCPVPMLGCLIINSLLRLLQLFIMGMAISKYNPLTNSCLTITN